MKLQNDRAVLSSSRRLSLAAVLLSLLAIACSSETDGKAKAAASQDVQAADAGLGADAGSDSADPADAASKTDTGPETLANLQLLAVTPAQGKASGGDTVTLTGTGFVETAQVLFGGTPLDPAHVFFLDAQTIQVKAPPHDTGLVDVAVVVPADPPVSSQLQNAFLYYNDIVISKVEPAFGPTSGGTAVTIKGSGFAGKTTVLFGGKPAINVQILSDEQIIAVTPPGTFGAAAVHVVNERGAGLQKKGFFYTTAPTIGSVEPASGPTAGGTVATVHGQGFTKDTEISIGGAKATVLEVTSTVALQIVTPPGPLGKATVTAVTKYGSGLLPGGYVYSDDKGQAATQILSVAPAEGPMTGGNTVALIATGLVSASDTTVLIGNKSAKIVKVSAAAHTALVTVPKASVAGPVDITLITSKGSDKAIAGYKYLDQLSLLSATPPIGPAAGGTTVSLKGSGFAKGKPMVKIGALPAAAVTVVSDAELTVVTPPGTAGYVDIVVKVGEGVAALKNGFSYTGAELQIYVPFPNSGAQAGGTLIQLYGNGFTAQTQVTFGGLPATHFTFIDATHVACKTPAGKVGAVDVAAVVGNQKAVLPNGFTYFNPMSAYGGTWGAEVDGAINITVIEPSGNPVPDCFVMLWTDPTTPYQGFSDANGQITFSGDNLAGKQMVSVSKEGYESASIVLFDAANVTLIIHPIPPPTPGSPPPAGKPPTIAGHVVGLDKYVFVPTGSCDSAQPACTGCSTDTDCASGGKFACVDLGSPNGKRCLQACTATCGTGYRCQPVGNSGARCVPAAGELTSVCYHSKDSIFAADNDPKEGAGFEASPAKSYAYKITVGYGEQAVICFGGYKDFGTILAIGDPSMDGFTPMMMGVKRHVLVAPVIDPKTGKASAPNLTNVDVVLDIPLTAKAQVRLDKPPIWPTAPGAFLINALQAHLVLGSDGAIRMPQVFGDGPILSQKMSTQPGADQLELNLLPASLSGTIHDASLSFLAFVVEYDPGPPPNQLPVSITVKNDIKDLSNDSMILRTAGSAFETVDTGVKKNIYGMWGTTAKNLYAVGAQGTLVHWDGGGWSMQPTFTKQDLLGVYGTDALHIWAVGWAGAAGYYDGLTWKTIPVQGAGANLHGVYAVADGKGGYAAWAAGQGGVWQLNNVAGVQTWTKSPGLFFDYFGIHGTDAQHVWAVGQYGQIGTWNGLAWKSQSSGTSIALRGVWAANPTSVYAVGEAGQILHFNGVAWKPMPSPVKTTLSGIWGLSDTDIWASGQRGTLVHWDGTSWKKQDLKDVDKSLNAVWANAAGTVMAMGEQEMLMGPLLYPPLADTPKNEGLLVGNQLKWIVDPTTVLPHFNYVTIGIPGMGPDTPVWNIMTKGTLSQVELPDFPAIQGTPGIPKDTLMRLTLIRGYKEGFDIDHYDNSDMNQFTWRSWALNSLFFQRQ